MEARLTFHSSDHQLTLERVICPSSVTLTAPLLFTGSDIKIAILLECLGTAWGQEELPGLFDSWMLELLGWESWARAARRIPGAGRGREGASHPRKLLGVSVASSQLCQLPT